MIAQGHTGLRLQIYKFFIYLQCYIVIIMKYAEYQKAFSAARLNKYLKACNGDFSSALTLYRHNVKLCQKFYGVLNIFEVVLRNAINNHYRTYYGDEDWIRNQLVTGGMLENHPQRAAVDKIIADLDKTGRYSNDRVVSSVTLVFGHICFPESHSLLEDNPFSTFFQQRQKVWVKE